MSNLFCPYLFILCDPIPHCAHRKMVEIFHFKIATPKRSETHYFTWITLDGALFSEWNVYFWTKRTKESNWMISELNFSIWMNEVKNVRQSQSSQSVSQSLFWKCDGCVKIVFKSFTNYIFVILCLKTFTMSDEIAENGTTNGDVPEIELIIKVELDITRVSSKD